MAKKKAAACKPAERAVMVTTLHRGVFFGYADDVDGEAITLKRARNCIYWSPDMRGVFGLASMGPSADCRIGPAVETLTLRNVTSVSTVTAEAADRWEAAPWK